MSVFYSEFIKLCSKKQVSPASVADAVGISSAAISGWKNGNLPRDSTVQRIADYFGVSVDSLNGKDEYYLDAETAELAQELFDNHELRVLFDAARDASPEDLKTTYNVLMALKKKEGKQSE